MRIGKISTQLSSSHLLMALLLIHQDFKNPRQSGLSRLEASDSVG